MKNAILTFSFLLFIFNPALNQDSVSYTDLAFNPAKRLISGFIRGGLYSWTDQSGKEFSVTSAFSDFGLKVETGNEINFKASADIRFRYGSEFLKPVSNFDVREAFIKINGKRWDLSLGQQIIKWGRGDFTNPTSKFSPQNMVSRSPDREDMNMGNLISAVNLFPAEIIDIEIVLAPYYRPSRLITDPVPLPKNVILSQPASLMTGNGMLSYGIKADFFMSGFDWSISWFNGFDPLPGIALSSFNMDLSQPFPVTRTELAISPYKNRVLGFDFETASGAAGFRGEACWSMPELSYKTNEYVPMPEIKWVAGVDWTSGNWRFTGEYSGKYITDFEISPVEPFIGSDPDYTKLAEMFAVPGFNPEDYVRQQVSSFNRLYNYQLYRVCHSAGLRAEAELNYGKLLPSVFAMYNFTSDDLLIIPEIRLKPADGVAITAGAEIYSGRKGSLYDLINDFMTGVYLSFRVDF